MWPGAIGGKTGTADRPFAVIFRVAAKKTLVDAAIGRAVEGKSQMFQFDHRFDGVPAKDFGGVLVHQIIAAFHRVEHMPFGTVGFRVSQGGRNAPLRRARVGPGGIKFRQNGHVALLLSEGERGVETGAAGPDDQIIKAMRVYSTHLS
jgi:hypothetical protein